MVIRAFCDGNSVEIESLRLAGVETAQWLIVAAPDAFEAGQIKVIAILQQRCFEIETNEISLRILDACAAARERKAERRDGLVRISAAIHGYRAPAYCPFPFL
jgi:hypothetical protein